MKKGAIATAVLVMVLVGAGLVYWLVAGNKDESKAKTIPQQAATKTYSDAGGGVKLQLPVAYQEVPVNNSEAASNTKSTVLLQLQRSSPQAFVVVQRDTGVSTVTGMLRQSALEYVEGNIRQFYPVKYGKSYASESLKRTKVGSKDAVEHVFSYTDADGKPNKVRMLVVINTDDETYTIRVQSHADNFVTVKGDLDSVKQSFSAR